MSLQQQVKQIMVWNAPSMKVISINRTTNTWKSISNAFQTNPSILRIISRHTHMLISLNKKCEMKNVKPKLRKAPVEELTHSEKWSVPSNLRNVYKSIHRRLPSHIWRYYVPHFKYIDFTRKLLPIGTLETTQITYWNMITFALKQNQIEQEIQGAA